MRRSLRPEVEMNTNQGGHRCDRCDDGCDRCDHGNHDIGPGKPLYTAGHLLHWTLAILMAEGEGDGRGALHWECCDAHKRRTAHPRPIARHYSPAGHVRARL